MNTNSLALTRENNSFCLNTIGTDKPGQNMHNSTTSEAPSIKRAQYLELLIPIKKKLYNFIHKAMNFSEDSDDIYQEALLKGYKYFHSYNPDKNFKSWLFTIANNLIKDHYRKMKFIIPLEPNNIMQQEDQSIPLKIKDIHHAVGELKPHHRQVFFLFYYNEFKITEISIITGLSESNIKFILAQSRKRVKKFLEVPE